MGQGGRSGKKQMDSRYALNKWTDVIYQLIRCRYKRMKRGKGDSRLFFFLTQTLDRMEKSIEGADLVRDEKNKAFGF